MPADFVQLKCENCGAPLRVFESEERVQCGHCRAVMVAARRGRDGRGVSLELVEQKLDLVAASAERTADELTHARLRAEVESLEERMKPMRDRLYMIIGLCILLSGPSILLGLFAIKTWGFVSLLIAAALIAMAILSLKRLSDHPLAAQEREVKLRMREVAARLDGAA